MFAHQFDKWQAFGRGSADDIYRFMFSSTPLMAAEETIMQNTIRGGIGYRDTETGDAVDFTPAEEEALLDMMVTMHRWFLMFGMVPIRAVEEGAAFGAVIPEFTMGYFVARVNHTDQIEVGWRRREQDTIGAHIGGVMNLVPDKRTKVFIWPGHRPSFQGSMPFRSRLAVCLHQADMIREVRNNFLDADYLASHPPIVMEMKETNDGRPHDVSTMEMRQNAIEAVMQGRSTQMQVQISRAKEMVTVQQEFSEEVVDSTMQRLGHAEDGSRQIIERDRMWGNNRFPMMPGYTSGRFQMPTVTQRMIDHEEHFAELIYSILRVPNPSAHRRAKNTAQHKGGGAQLHEGDVEMLRDTVRNTRDLLGRAFTFLYDNFMWEKETQALVVRKKSYEEAADRSINSVRDYLMYLKDTDQLETEPEFAKRMRLAEQQEQDEALADISYRVNEIASEAHKQGVYLDQETIFRHLRDVEEMKKMKEETVRKIDNRIRKRKRRELEWKVPPAVDASTLLSLAQAGMYNPEEAAKLINESMGIDKERSEKSLKGISYIPPLEKARLELEREKLKHQMALEDKKLQAQASMKDKEMKQAKELAGEKRKADAQKSGGEPKKAKNK